MAKGSKRSWWRTLLVVFFVGVLLLAIFSVVWLWRVEGDWNKFTAKWEARGEFFELEHYVPDHFPPDENLANHPPFLGLTVEGSEADLWFAQIDSKLVGAPEGKRVRPNKDLAQPADLSRWTDLEPSLTDAQRLAEILTRYEPLNDPLDQVAAALAERPVAHFPIDWEAGLMMSTPHVFEFLRVADAFHTRALLRLRSGDSPGATEDILATERLARAAGQDRYLIALLVQLAIHRSNLDILWEGMHRQIFTDEDLARIAEELALAPALGKTVLTALRIERAFCLHYIDQLQFNPATFKPGLKRSDHKHLVRAWFYSNRLAVARDLQEQFLAPNGTLAPRATLSHAQETERRLDQRLSGLRKYFHALAFAAPRPFKPTSRALKIEAELANARIAIALERHRLAHGSCPPSLAVLVPEFLPELPTDLINARPVEYRLQPDGSPLIYQWGCDGDDDRGRPHKDALFGDVVWHYHPDPPVTDREYRVKVDP